MQQDAPEFFTAVRNTSIQMVGATPIDADQKLISSPGYFPDLVLAMAKDFSWRKNAEAAKF
jgi:hypothetical protein